MNLHAESRSRRSALGTEQRIAICTLVLALSSFLAGCGKSSANAPGAGPGAMPVQVRIATAAKIPETTEYLSILKSRHSAAINPQVEGQLTKILVKSGEQVNEQKVELHYYSVSAPMDGSVGDIPVHVGDRVTVGTLLTTVDEPGALEAYIYVPAEKARNLKIGLRVRLFDGAGSRVSDTEVTFVSPQVDTDTQTVLAKAAVQNPKSKVRIAE